MDIDFLGDESTVNRKPDDKAGERTWQIKKTLGDGVFDFFRIELPGTEGNRARSMVGNTLRPEALDANGYIEPIEKLSLTRPGIQSVAYLSFWLYTPLEINEKSPALSLVVTSDDGKNIWCNGSQLISDNKICGPGMTNTSKIPLTLNKGWNHLLIKSGQLDGPWSFNAKFESDDLTLLQKIKASATQPDSD